MRKVAETMRIRKITNARCWPRVMHNGFGLVGFSISAGSPSRISELWDDGEWTKKLTNKKTKLDSY